MRKLRRDWDAFWFAPQTALALGLYRIVLGLLTIYSFALWAKDVDVFFSDDGVLTRETIQTSLGRTVHTVLLWTGSPMGVRIVLALLFASAVCFTIGYRARLSSVLLFVLVASFHERNNLVLNGGDSVLRTMLFFFMFAPSGAAFSVDALLERGRLPPGTVPDPVLVRPWPQHMMQVQVAVIYFVTAYAKTRGALYHNGTAMYYVFGLVDFNRRGVEQLMNLPVVYSFLTYFVLAAEVSIPFLLWFRATRPYAVALGLLAHGWIIGAMIIPVFGTLMLATYLPFFSEAEIDGLIARLRRRFEGRQARVYFDGACASCRRARAVLEGMDLLGRLDARDARSDPPPPGLGRDALLDELVLVTPRGAALRGFDAYRWMAARLPAAAWSTPLWHLPFVAPLGRALCRRLSRARSASSRCDAGLADS